MNRSNSKLNRELLMGAQYAAEHLTPAPGAIPKIPNVDIYGTSLPFNGVVGGDVISYVNFQDRFDLDARIENALSKGQKEKARALYEMKNCGGIMVADVAGHDFADALRGLMLHQAFYTAALYEMDLKGEITVRLFEQINTRFLKSKTLRNLAAPRDTAIFISLIYGEIYQTGRFRFVSAGHPAPLVFSQEYDRFVEISTDRMVSYPPIGLQPGEDQADASHYERALGYKKQYTVNELNLMGKGDVLLLYTDGLHDPFSKYTQKHLERDIARVKEKGAKEICESILEERLAMSKQTDDLSLVVIKYG